MPKGAKAPGTGGGKGRRVSASEFKTHCLRRMDRVSRTREEITVTKYGKPVAMLAPFEPERVPVVGFLRESVLRYGDLISPVDEPWEADG